MISRVMGIKQSKRFIEFFENEKAGGLVLLFATVISLLFANSVFQTEYVNFWQVAIGGETLIHWINDGFMTIFFLHIGLELKREIYKGELAKLKNATLPIFGALGGMIIPAAIFLFINAGTDHKSGAGIPMATDIAFAVGILSLLGSRVPTSLKVFLTALAVIDDLGAIVVIAVFYTSTLSLNSLFIALAIWGVLLVLNRFKMYSLLPYLIGGIAMWYFVLNSGIHATISGVLLAFAIPLDCDNKKKSPSNSVLHYLHKPVAFFILPLFALANTCIALGDNWTKDLNQTSSVGIIAGLMIGKPLGILLFSFIGVNSGLCALPEKLKWRIILGVGFLGGIGFTMSIFITLLAFNDSTVIDSAKIAILLASFASGLIGYSWLKMTLNK